MARTRLAAVVVLALLALPAGSSAEPTITEFPTTTPNSFPIGIANGPDGNLWFTEFADPGQIGRITPNGLITEFPTTTPNSGPIRITAGPDGNLWFTEAKANKIGRITPTGTITEFDIPTPNSDAGGITRGPDGNVWFAEGAAGKIGKITPTGTITEFPLPTPDSGPSNITTGADGNLWFTLRADPGRIGRITPNGVVTEFTQGLTPNASPRGITPGPDGNVWFTTVGVGRVGLITPSGVITELAGPYSPAEIAAGPDGNLWFTQGVQTDPSAIGRITPSGTVTQYTTGLSPNRNLAAITAGPDGNLWFAEAANPGRIGRITPGPRAVTGDASDLTLTTANVTGSVTPNGQATTYKFQYGTDTNYGSETAAGSAGAGLAATPVQAALSGLSQGTTYHYRVVATNDSDTTFGADRTFTTVAPDPQPDPDPDPQPGPDPDPQPGPDPDPDPGPALGPTAPVAPLPPNLNALKSVISVNRKRRFGARFQATPALTGRLVFKRSKRRIARKAFTVSADGRVKLKLRLSKKNFRLLKRRRKLRTRATVTVVNTAGLTSQASKRVTLKAPRRR